MISWLIYLDLLKMLRCLEKAKKYSPKWCVDGDLPWCNVNKKP